MKSFHVCRIRKLKLRIFHQSICQDQKENIIKAGDSVQSAGLTLICCTARRGGGAEGDKIDMQSLAELSALATKEIFVLNTEK